MWQLNREEHEVHEAFQSVIKEFTDTQMLKVFICIACHNNPLFFLRVLRGLCGEMLFLGLL
jgi:hypothetical protein